jgi:DNA-binding GntR family transcriptional regulator
MSTPYPENTATNAKLTSDQITAELRARIYSGILAGGVQLKQEELADAFGVSRIPVREALARLEAEGLVKHMPRKGTVVLSHSVDDVIEMLDIRIALETRALKLAIPNLSASDLNTAEAILDEYNASNKPSQWSDLNLRFHMFLYAAAKKPNLLKMIEEVVLGTQRYTRIQISTTVGREKPQREHYELLCALREGNADKAIGLLEAHIEHTQSVLRSLRE